MTNYLYNGVKLPALPEWDKTTYPYAYLCNHDGTYMLVLAKDIKGVNSSGYLHSIYGSNELIYALEDGTWVISSFVGNMHGLFWASTDVYYVSGTGSLAGTLYLSATDPIPVGTITDPESFLIGYQIGCRLRAQRAIKKPLLYRYGEITTGTYAVAPPLPHYNKEVYRYAAIDGYNGLFVSKEPIVARQNSAGNWIPTIESDALLFKLIDNKSERATWGESTNIEAGKTLVSIYWCDYDLYKANGEIFKKAFEPVPMYVPIVLFDGEHTTTEGFSDDYIGYGLNLNAEFALGDTLRITLDGKTYEYVAFEYGGYEAAAGNTFLGDVSGTGALDDGNDVFVRMGGYGIWLRTAYVYTRTAGIHRLKIELIATGEGG